MPGAVPETGGFQDKMAWRAMFVVKPETGGFQAKIARCDVLREAAADARQAKIAGCDVLREAVRRGCPCPVAGRSLRPSLASAHCMPSALRHPACACRQARLSGHGQPLVHSAAKRPARRMRSADQKPEVSKTKSHAAMFCVKLAVGAARAPSPDVRRGHPWPPLTACRLRFGILPALAAKPGSRGTDSPSSIALPEDRPGRMPGAAPASGCSPSKNRRMRCFA